MPRGSNPNSRANLKKLSPSEARKNGRKGGKISGEVRKEWKTYREAAKELVSSEDREAHIKKLILMGKMGNMKAIELLMKILGESVEQVQVVTLSPEAVKDVEDFINGIECGEEETSDTAKNESS